MIYHKSIHGFRQQRGTGTAILDAKLVMSQAEISGQTLYQVFIDLTKAYDAIPREILLDVMKKYGLGTRCSRLLEKFWNGQELALKQSSFVGRKFKAKRGVTQGYIISPIAFNMIVDAVVRLVERETKGNRD